VKHLIPILVAAVTLLVAGTLRADPLYPDVAHRSHATPEVWQHSSNPISPPRANTNRSRHRTISGMGVDVLPLHGPLLLLAVG
jgi:hypothetical protein